MRGAEGAATVTTMGEPGLNGVAGSASTRIRGEALAQLDPRGEVRDADGQKCPVQPPSEPANRDPKALRRHGTEPLVREMLRDRPQMGLLNSLSTRVLYD